MKKYFITFGLILISIFMGLLSACGESYDNLSLHFSSQSIELEQNSSKDYEIAVENYFSSNIHFNFSFDTQIATVSNTTDLGGGRYRITVTGHTPGKATLTITLLENSKYISIPVKVYEPISSMSLKDGTELYVIRGQSLQLSSDMLEFYPLSTLDREVRFQIGTEAIENSLLVTNQDTPDEIVVTAVSLTNENITCSFSVKVFDQINTQNIFLSDNDTVLPTIEQDSESYIELIENDKELFKKTLQLAYDEAYVYEIFSNSTHTVAETSQSENMQNIKDVTIQASDFSLVDDVLVIRVKYAGYDAYYVDLLYSVKIASVPESVLINGFSDAQEINLFNNDDVNSAKQFLFSVVPSGSDYEHLTLSFYISNGDDLREVKYSEISHYICAIYGALEISDDIEIKDLTIPLKVYGRSVLAETLGDSIVVRATVSAELTSEPIYNDIRLKIQKSATDFRVDNTYANSTIYVKNGDSVTFNGFVVQEPDAYIGTIVASNNDVVSLNICTVTQTAENVASIDIVAHKAGEAHYTLVLESGLSTHITIIVKDELDIDNLWFYVGTNEEKVAEVQYKQINNNETLDFIAVRGLGDVTILANTSPRDITGQSMFEISYQTDSTNISVNQNMLTFTSVDNTRQTIHVEVRMNRIENFMLVVDDDVLQSTQFDFDVICFKPISSFTFDALNSGNLDGTYSSTVDVYNLNTPLGYVDTPMSMLNFRLMLDGVETDVNDLILNNLDLEFEFSVSSIYDSANSRYELTDSGSIVYGYFYNDLMTFVCDAIGNPIATFTITAKIYEYGTIISSTVKINIVQYVQVEEVWLYNYFNEIYLDPSHTEEVIYPYILPQNATNQSFTAWFEPNENTSSTIVQLQYDENKIVITYTGAGGGSGVIKIVPNSSFYDSDRNAYRFSKDIPIVVGDGSISSPLHIGTWEQLKTIDLSKYYVIDGTIDGGGEEIAPLGELKGGVAGMTSSDGSVSTITNFKITSAYAVTTGTNAGNYYGLFSSIASGAYLKDLTVSGAIEIDNITTTSYIGLLAGVNNGKIENVNVNLSQSTVQVQSAITAYIGGGVGQNKGEYVVDIQNSSPNSTLFVNMQTNEAFNVNLSGGTSYVGGVVGENRGVVQFTKPANMNTYNNYGVSSQAYLNVSGSDSDMGGIGGIIGQNYGGDVLNLLATGRVNASQSTNVGGLIGRMDNAGKVLNNTSRVYVRGNTYVAGLIGYVVNSASEDIANNKVEATDDRTMQGLDATLIVSNTSASIAKIFNSANVNVHSSNTALSYITRTFVQYGQSGNKEGINTYYGELVAGANVELEQFERAFDVNMPENYLNLKTDKIVLMYYEAKDSVNQKYLNVLNTQSLPSEIFAQNVEITISSNATSVVSITTEGRLRLHKTGTAILTLTSAHNASISQQITCVVTNYVSGVNLYLSSDYTNELTQNSQIGVTNRSTVNIYPRFDAVANVGNMRIELKNNNVAKLDIESNQNVKVMQSSGTVILQGAGTESQTTPEEIKFYIYLDVNNTKMYLVKNGEQNYTFKETTKDQVMPSAVLYTTYTQGIYNIESDKTNISLVPSDVFMIKVSYLTDDIDDKIELYVTYLENGEVLKFGESDFDNYFIANVSDVYFENGRYYVDYTFEMNTENAVRIGNYKFTFTGSDGAVKKDVYATFSAQPINNVIVKNYSFTNNEDVILIETDEGYYVYNTSYSMTETNIVTAGESNILKVVINPEYSDYAYIEVTNSQENISSGNVVLFGLLVPRNNEPGQAIISSDAFFTSTGIRVMKSSIVGGELNVLYRMATNVIEGDSITLYVNFYNAKGEIIYSQQQKVLTISLNKTVEVSIADRVVSDHYYVARGYNYLLNINTVGYNISDVIIESSSSYAQIIKDNGAYYLKIADNISYPHGQQYGGYDVTITYYGTTTVDGVTTSGIRNSFICTIVEYVLGDLNDMNEVFENSEIVLNRGNSADIRDLIIDNLDVEYSGNATTAVKALKASLKQNGVFYYKLSDENGFIRITDQTNISTDIVDISGYNITTKYVGENLFSLGVFAKLQYLDGYVQVMALSDEEISNISDVDIKQFNVRVNQTTSLDSPLPIYTQEQLMNMSDDNYYILMDDITITSDFIPIDASIARLDGNSHKIIFSGIYSDYTSVDNFGLFSTVDEDSVICNLTVEIGRNTTFNFRNESSANSFNFGLITAQNNGTITNCQVVYQDDASSLIVTNSAPMSLTSTSNISPFVAVNSGYITNSRVNVRIESFGANLAGFVAVNNGHIASSYVKRSYIRNSSTNVNNSTAGFVAQNYGTVFASYIEGAFSTGLSYIYATDTNYIIRANSIAGAFAYINEGTISNCYANIPLTSSSINSGFVCTNNGEIISSYTTSKLGDRDTGNYPFFITCTGTISDSYYLSDENFNVGINVSNGLYGEGLTAIPVISFAIGYAVTSSGSDYTVGEKLFNNFAINTNNDITSGVWFYAKDNNSYLTNNTITTGSKISASDYRNYLQYSRLITVQSLQSDGQYMQFRENRPQLVTANIIASSSKYISSTQYVEETGETLYVYAETPGSNTEGSMYNPIIVTSAVRFEEDFISNSIRSVNSKYYRLVKDIDYTAENLVVSSLYSYTLAGYFEGNGLTISNFSINTSTGLTSGGYFAQIGDGNDYTTIQNVEFSPKYINLPNAVNVGTVAGTVYRVYAYNITVDGYNSGNSSNVVLGKNIVGGVFGRTVNSFDIQNIYSSISTNAYQTNNNSNWTTQAVQNEILYEEGGSNYNTVSYSGSIVGYLGGVGVLKNANITNAVATIGMVSGFMFGGVGMNAEVRDVSYEYEVLDNYFIRASAYGGVIVGDLKGTLRNVKVSGVSTENGEYVTTYYIFNLTPKIPIAVGGLCGIVRGTTQQPANIYDCDVDINIQFNNTIVVGSVGGLAGKVLQSVTIDNSNFTGDLTGQNALGGIIGEVKFSGTFGNITITDFAVGGDDATNLTLIKPAQEEKSVASYAGSVIGLITSDGASITKGGTLEIIANSINTSISSDISIYGDNSISDTNQVSELYGVYISKLIGGYYGSITDEVNDIQLEIYGLNVEIDLSIKNLRVGNTSTGVPHQYAIYLATVVYDFDAGDYVGLDVPGGDYTLNGIANTWNSYYVLISEDKITEG